MKMKSIRPLVQIPVRADGIKAEKLGDVAIQLPSSRLAITDGMTAAADDAPPHYCGVVGFFPCDSVIRIIPIFSQRLDLNACGAGM